MAVNKHVTSSIDDDVSPLISPGTDNDISSDEASVSFTPQLSSASNYGSGKSTMVDNKHVASPIDDDVLILIPAGADSDNPTNQPTSSGDNDRQLPILATDDDGQVVVVPSPRKHLALTIYCKKTVHITYGDDSKEWVINTLKPFLINLHSEVITISDAIPGRTHHSAHIDFIYKVNKIILVISKESIKNKLFYMILIMP